MKQGGGREAYGVAQIPAAPTPAEESPPPHRNRPPPPLQHRIHPPPDPRSQPITSQINFARCGSGAGEQEVRLAAWMRMMAADSVAYRRHTVLERGDDHPGMALANYASRGETPLRWGGSGAEARPHRPGEP
jgi:hypothetical protein